MTYTRKKTLVEDPERSVSVPVADWSEDSAYAVLSEGTVVLVRLVWEGAVKASEPVLRSKGLSCEEGP